MMDRLNMVIEAALAAGREIIKVYNSSDFNVEMKADNSPLTLADKKAHQVIVSYLEATNIPILSEEGEVIPYESREDWAQLWIVDPLDGTKEFIKRNGEFTVNIALVEKGVPVLGVVYVPILKDLYFASKELGSFKLTLDANSDMEMILKQAQKLPLNYKKENYTVVASRSHLSNETQDYIKAIGKDVELISSGSSIKICLVAEGRADVYPRFAPTMEWDTAAGHAIALYAQKNIYRVDEKTPLEYNKENLLNPWFIVK